MRVPRIIYRNDPNWISHLDRDIEAVFDPAMNNHFQHGEAVRWIMKDAGGNLIGRVAAFINRQLATTHDQPTGGMGFFECVNDKDAAFALFDKCKDWLEGFGMEAMEGPVNFGEKDRFWGLLVRNQGYKPPYRMNYNPLYYKELFEAYGFRNFYEQYVFRGQRDKKFHPLFEKKYRRLIESDGYSFQTLDKKNLEKYAHDFMTIYNEAWKDSHQHFKPLSINDVMKIFNSMKSIIDPEIVIFVYYKDQPVAFFINIPELNQLFSYVKGKLNFLGKLKFLFYRWLGECHTIYGLVFGIVPEHRGKGIESAMVMKLRNIVLSSNRYYDMYISWIGDFNRKMIRLIEAMELEKIFILVTYKKLFDPDAKFERHPVLD